MQTKPPTNKEKPAEQPPVPPRRWFPRQFLLIALVIAALGLLSPLALLYTIRSQSQVQTKDRAPRKTATSTSSLASTPSPLRTPLDSRVAAQIDTLLTGQVTNRQFSGSVLVAQGTQVILAKGYSMANWDTQTPNTPHTRFFLGSVTKEFTAMALLILQQQGKLQVQNLLCSYIANCPSPWHTITVQEVLIHTSGIPELDTSQLSADSPDAWIASFDDVSLNFTPGSQFSYCSVCYQVLAYVVQQVSGIPYDQYIQQSILNPLHMDETSFDSNAYYANSYGAIGNDTWQNSAEQLGWDLDPEWDFLDGSGLLYSTIQDLYRWDQALYISRLLPPAVLKQAFTPYVTANLFPGSQYGYGWFISRAPVQGHQLIWHDGVIDGFRNFIGRYIGDQMTIIIQSNLATTDVIGLSHSIEQILFGTTSSN